MGQLARIEARWQHGCAGPGAALTEQLVGAQGRLLAGRVGVEVKTGGGRNDVVRQLTRYAHCPEVDELVLVTTRAKHHHMPAEVAGKPVHLVSLIGAAL